MSRHHVNMQGVCVIAQDIIKPKRKHSVVVGEAWHVFRESTHPLLQHSVALRFLLQPGAPLTVMWLLPGLCCQLPLALLILPKARLRV